MHCQSQSIWDTLVGYTNFTASAQLFCHTVIAWSVDDRSRVRAVDDRSRVEGSAAMESPLTIATLVTCCVSSMNLSA